MAYELQFKPSAARQFKKLDREMQKRIARRLDALVTEPLPPDAKKLQAELDLYRIRVGDYRLIYQLRNKQLLILVVAVGHRRDIYRKL